MARYIITVKETSLNIIDVEAQNENQAKNIALMFYDEYGEYIDSSAEVIEIKEEK